MDTPLQTPATVAPVSRSDRDTGVAFLDRDGTINAKAPAGEYVTAPADLALLPGAAAAIRRLNDAGVEVIVVTNQRGLALERMTEADLAAIHDRLRALLAEQGAHIDAIYVCPHADHACECRKPRPGMLLQAARDRPWLSLGASVIVGDQASDVLAGQRAGTACVLVGDADAEEISSPYERARDLGEAVTIVLERIRG